MNAFKRLITFGAADADRRVAARLAPRDYAAAERYVLSSRCIGALDRLTKRFESWWFESQTRQAVIAFADAWSRETRSSRNYLVGVAALVAAATHATLMLWQGPPPQLYWLLVPALAAAVGVLLLVSARAADLRRDE